MASRDELWRAALKRQDAVPLQHRYEYDSETGIGLMHNCVTALGARIARLMGITRHIKRMDSMRKSREHPQAHPQRADKLCLESRSAASSGLAELGAGLTCTRAANMAGRCHKDGRDGLIAGMGHCYDPEDFNKRFYHATGSESRSASF